LLDAKTHSTDYSIPAAVRERQIIRDNHSVESLNPSCFTCTIQFNADPVGKMAAYRETTCPYLWIEQVSPIPDYLVLSATSQ